MRAFLLSALFFIAGGFQTLSAVDLDVMRMFTPEVMELRNTKESTLKMIEILKAEFATNTNSYDACIKLSLTWYYLGNFHEKDRDKKLAAFVQCREYARMAIALRPGGAAGHYWLGVAIGIWSETNGILDSLFNAETVLKEMNEVIRIQPDYFLGLPWAIRAKVYYYVPEFLYGNKKKAWSDIRTAIKYGPELRFNWEYYTELLVKDGKWAEADEAVDKGIGLPFDQKIALEENFSMKSLTNYRRIIHENLRKN